MEQDGGVDTSAFHFPCEIPRLLYRNALGDRGKGESDMEKNNHDQCYFRQPFEGGANRYS